MRGTKSVTDGKLPLLFASLFICQSAGAAAPGVTAAPAKFSYLGMINESESRIGAPAVFARLEAMQPEEQVTFAKTHRAHFDRLRTMRSLAGDATGAAQASVWFDIADGALSRHAASKSGELDTVVPDDAVQAIVREARNRRIVILNEAHHVPVHRVFASRLASELRKIGYTYLAAEAFAPGVPAHPATPRQVDGFYVREPMYASFVRSAIRDGWTFVAYDHVSTEASTPAERSRLREVGAARNLVERIFSKNPEAKVFMYVGYGHAQEMPKAGPNGYTTVATVLKESTGLDPLTIDQASMYGRGDVRVDLPRYRAAMQRFAPGKPLVFKTASRGYVLDSSRPGYDMQVFHPDETAHGPHGRPLWMERQAGLKPHPVPAGLLPANGRRLIQAFHAGDGEGAIPVDQVMVEAGKPAASLMLPDGQFRFGYEE